MHGTVARSRIKPGSEQKLAEIEEQYRAMYMPGFVAQYNYRLDADPLDYYKVLLFESKQAYLSFANTP